MQNRRLRIKGYPTKEEAERTLDQVIRSMGLIKMCMGIYINASMYMAMNANDSIKKHPLYKHKVKAAFRRIETVFKDFENTLRYGTVNSVELFKREHLANSDVFKEGFTNGEYYEFWQALGGAGYTLSIKEIENVRKAYYDILVATETPYPEICKDLLTTIALLTNTKDIFNESIEQVKKSITRLDNDDIDYLYGILDISKWLNAWKYAVALVFDFDSLKISDHDYKQLCKALSAIKVKWTNLKWIEKVEKQTMKDYQNFFRSEDIYKSIKTEIKNEFEKYGNKTTDKTQAVKANKKSRKKTNEANA